ncbi:hypothetical protein CC78DRAFT_540217 [Lojkania enalia]|uniref:HTH psq-type domain-containing protein n=1 Tax=Lojkania enalia TaxID=147567 RepID=A0A9P4N9M4_9PLEO|nr:hypothetical protein CC78DRAFT_540217 [Didymosphaeria enalia]
MGSLEAALTAIESLAPGESMNYSKIAREYGVVYSTLARRHQAQTRPREDKGINRRKLSPHGLINKKGFLLSVITRLKRIFSRQEYERKEVRSALDLALIYKAGLEGLLLGWVEDINPDEYLVFIILSPSSLTNNKIGLI